MFKKITFLIKDNFRGLWCSKFIYQPKTPYLYCCREIHLIKWQSSMHYRVISELFHDKFLHLKRKRRVMKQKCMYKQINTYTNYNFLIRNILLWIFLLYPNFTNKHSKLISESHLQYLEEVQSGTISVAKRDETETKEGEHIRNDKNRYHREHGQGCVFSILF